MNDAHYSQPGEHEFDVAGSTHQVWESDLVTAGSNYFPLVIPIIKWNCSKNKEILVYTEIKSRARKTLTWRHNGFICWHAASTCKMCSCMMRHS